MKMRKYLGLVLVFSLAIGSLGTSTTAAEPQNDGETVSTIERASGWFSTDISAGKYKKIGGEISLMEGEGILFTATYSPRDASVDFGVVDSNNVFTYINVTTGIVDGGVAVTANGQYTPAIRNNSSDSINVAGTVTTGLPSTN